MKTCEKCEVELTEERQDKNTCHKCEMEQIKAEVGKEQWYFASIVINIVTLAISWFFGGAIVEFMGNEFQIDFYGQGIIVAIGAVISILLAIFVIPKDWKKLKIGSICFGVFTFIISFLY